MVALDTRGCGDSDKPSGIGSYHRNHLAADVKAVIAALGYEKASLIGHDWGGVVLWKVVEDYPEIVDRFIALNSPHHDAGLSHALQNPKQLLIGSWYMYVFMVSLLNGGVIQFAKSCISRQKSIKLSFCTTVGYIFQNRTWSWASGWCMGLRNWFCGFYARPNHLPCCMYFTNIKI